MTLPCESYCSHGGICALSHGHDGRHDSVYCTWSDEEAISKEDADVLFRKAGGAAAEAIIAMTDFTLSILKRE
jgi:hypothetical protein